MKNYVDDDDDYYYLPIPIILPFHQRAQHKKKSKTKQRCTNTTTTTAATRRNRNRAMGSTCCTDSPNKSTKKLNHLHRRRQFTFVRFQDNNDLENHLIYCSPHALLQFAEQSLLYHRMYQKYIIYFFEHFVCFLCAFKVKFVDSASPPFFFLANK